MNATRVLSVDRQGNVVRLDFGWPASDERLAHPARADAKSPKPAACRGLLRLLAVRSQPETQSDSAH